MKIEMILKEGYLYILTSLGLFLISLLFDFNVFWQLLFFIVFCFFVYFFRNPERVPEDSSKNAIISPSDGEIIEIREAIAPIINEKMIKISIRLSLFDVHVQRAPIDSKITTKEYIHGMFLFLSDKKASELNEQNRVLFEGLNKVVVNQIAGFITRRIVDFGCKEVKLSQRYGMIIFGSQVDLYIPKDSKIMITEFQEVKAGESLIGFLNEN